MKKKLSILIAICMIVTMIPAAAFAETGSVPNTTSMGGATIVGGASFETLSQAVGEAQDGDTIRLDGDASGMIVIQFKDIEIDGNGYKIVFDEPREFFSIMGGNVKLTNAHVIHSNTGMDISNGAVVLVEKCTFTWAAETSRSIVCYNSAAVTVRDCKFNDDQFTGGLGEMTCVEAGEKAVVNVTDCRMEVAGTGVQVLHSGDVRCTDCVVIMGAGNAVEVHPFGRLYIDGGYYKGEAGMVVYDKAKVTVKSGWFQPIHEMTPAITGVKANVTVEEGSNISPADWQTSTPDHIQVNVDIARPQNLKVNLSGKYNTIKASWGKSNSADGYAVYLKKGQGSYVLKGRTTGTSYVLKNLQAGANFTVKVVPYHIVQGADGPMYMEVSNVATKSVYTLKKVVLKNFQKKNGKVNVRWNNINGESGYQISRTLKKNSTNIFATVSGAAKVNKLVKANKGQKYFYKVRAYKVVNGKKIFGPWSNVKQYKR